MESIIDFTKLFGNGINACRVEDCAMIKFSNNYATFLAVQRGDIS